MKRIVSTLGLILLAGATSADVIRIEPTPPQKMGATSVTFSHDEGALAVFDVSGDFSNPLDSEPRKAVAEAYYETHRDDVDFLISFATFPVSTGESAAFALRVRNDVAGIGMDFHDYSADFGSDGRLRTYVEMADLTRWETDSTQRDFHHSLGVLMHEIWHTWCCEVGADGVDPQILLGRDDDHWSFLLDTDASVMYGHEWRDDGGGQYTATAIRYGLSPLDLYLAGFLSPEEIPSFTLIESDDFLRTELPLLHATVEGVAQEVFIGDVASFEGMRIPSANEAPPGLQSSLCGAQTTRRNPL